MRNVVWVIPWRSILLIALLGFTPNGVHADETGSRAHVLRLHQELIRLKNMRDQNLEWAWRELRRAERFQSEIRTLQELKKRTVPKDAAEIESELRRLRIEMSLAIGHANDYEKSARFYDKWRKDWLSYFYQRLAEFPDLKNKLENVDTPPPLLEKPKPGS